MKTNWTNKTKNPEAVNRSLLAAIGDSLSLKTSRLNSQDLCAYAQRTTGLQDFGDPPIEPALSVLVNSLENEGDLHPVGRLVMRIHL
jgi:hypothetical protein